MTDFVELVKIIYAAAMEWRNGMMAINEEMVALWFFWVATEGILITFLYANRYSPAHNLRSLAAVAIPCLLAACNLATIYEQVIIWVLLIPQREFKDSHTPASPENSTSHKGDTQKGILSDWLLLFASGWLSMGSLASVAALVWGGLLTWVLVLVILIGPILGFAILVKRRIKVSHP